MVTNPRRFADDYRCGTTLLGLLLAGAASAPAGAQSVQEPVTELAFTAQLRHDGNLDSGATPGLETSDDRLSIGAAIRLARPFGRHSLALDGFLGYDFYRRNSQLNSERVALSADAEIDAGFCQLGLKPRISRQQSNLYELAVINVPGIGSVRNKETTQAYRGELRCGNALRIRPLVYYERSYGNNSSFTRKISNYQGETIGGGLSYSNPVLGTYDVAVERNTLKYPNRPTAFGPSGYRQDQIRISGSRNIGAVLTANGSIAFTHVKPQNAVSETFSGMSWSLSLTAVPMTDLQLTASLSQQIDPALSNSALFSRNRDWGLSATYRLGSRTSVGASFGRSERLFRGTFPVFGPVLTNDVVNRYSARADFTPNRRLSLGVEVGHERRNANGSFYDYRNTFVAVNTRFTLGR